MKYGKIKNNKDELQSRRDFFKKAAGTVLPLIGTIVLFGMPDLIKAAEKESTPLGCEDSCSDGCYGSCHGNCRGSCHDGCRGCCRGCCGDACTSCVGVCKDTCKNTCINIGVTYSS